MSDQIHRATGSPEKDILCKFCAHMKHWHGYPGGEGKCWVSDCDCEAWDYGVNVEVDVAVGVEKEETDV